MIAREGSCYNFCVVETKRKRKRGKKEKGGAAGRGKVRAGFVHFCGGGGALGWCGEKV